MAYMKAQRMVPKNNSTLSEVQKQADMLMEAVQEIFSSDMDNEDFDNGTL